MTTKIPKELSSTPGISDSSTGTSITINSDGYAKFERSGNEYGMEVKSAGTRSGIVFDKPGTDTIQGSILMMADESFRLGTAGNYHIYMLQNGATQIVNGLNILDGDMTLASGHGISFAATGDGSGTASSEILDDYEEGTWTPTFAGVAAAANYGATYIKMGRQVIAECYLAGDTQNNTNQFQVAGLPYTSANETTYGGGSIGYVGTRDLSELAAPIIAPNSNYVYFHYIDGSQAGNNVTNNVIWAKENNNLLFLAQFIYRAAS